MRTPLLAAFLGLTLFGCMIGGSGSDGTPTGGDDDGSGSAGGSGSNQQPPPTSPTFTVALDKTSVATELMTANPLTVTLTSALGFTGDVALAAQVVDSTGAAIPGWSVTFDKATVTVPANGNVSAVATVMVPSDSTMLAGTVKITANNTTVGMQAAQAPVTATNQVTFPMKLNNNACVLPLNTTANVKVGTKIRWLNMETASRITIHMETTLRDGLIHQPDPGSAPGQAYVLTAAVNSNGTVDGKPMAWYCHAPGGQSSPNDPKILVVP